MKKINYFGKEYTVGGDVEWVATSSYGTVLGFTYEPIQTDNGWAGNVPRRLDKLPSCTTDWKNSLRKVKDIIVKENEVRDGEFKIKCIDNKGNPWFKVGNEYRAWYEDTLLCSDSETDTICHDSLNSLHGVFEIVDEYKQHPHADIMLKYAQIAQYDDKPWEHFECDLGKGMWCDMVNAGFHTAFNYRLKPQEPKIQVGQVWVSKEGVRVTVSKLANKLVFINIEVGGLTIPWSFTENVFFGNFKHKE